MSNNLEFETMRYCSARDRGMSIDDTCRAISGVFEKHGKEVEILDIRRVVEKDLTMIGMRNDLMKLTK